jgi:hypothetical protein
MTIFDAGPLCTAAISAAVVILIGLGYFIMMRIADIEV